MRVSIQYSTPELESIVGVKHAKLEDRVGTWHGTTTGQVVLGARKIGVQRPRGRLVDGREVELDSWATFASEDLVRQVVVERMLAGVATRRHVRVGEPVGQTGIAVSKSAVSRRFVAATTAAVAELLEGELSGLYNGGVMIDGLNVVGGTIMVACRLRSRRFGRFIGQLAEDYDMAMDTAGTDLDEVWRRLEVGESTCHRWLAQCGGKKMSDAKRLKELEAE